MATQFTLNSMIQLDPFLDIYIKTI